MNDQDHTTFDPRIADWLEGDPNEAPDQALQVVLAAFPSIKQRRAMRLPWRFPRMSPIARAALAALVIALALGGALYVLRPTDQVAAPAVSPSVSASPSPEVVIPPGVASTRTMEQVIAMARARNAEMERELGRSLAPFRIIRIQLLRPGEQYTLRHLDGTVSPDRGGGVRTGGTYSNDAPTWVVEIMGTFLGDVPSVVPGSHPGPESRGMHGAYFVADNDNSTESFIPCWNQLVVEPTFSPAEMEGSCP